MKRKVQETKPLFPLKQEFEESLDAYVQAVMMLTNVLRSLIAADALGQPRAKEMIEEKLNALAKTEGQ